MTQDLNPSNPENVEFSEPSTEPSASQPSIQPPKPSFDLIKGSHDMMLSFREGVRNGTYQGKHLISIAQGLMFLDTLIGQSQGQLERAKAEQKEMFKRAKEEIAQAGGKINGGN